MNIQPAKNQPLSTTKKSFSTTSLNSVAGSSTSLTTTPQNLLESYLENIKKQGSAKATIRNYRSDIGQFIEFCKSEQLDFSKDNSCVEKFEDFQRKKQLKEASVRRKSVSVSSYLTWIKNQSNVQKTSTVAPSSLAQDNKITEITPKTIPNKPQGTDFLIPIEIEKVLNQYLTTLKYNTISDATIRNYRSDIKQFAFFTKAGSISLLLTLDGMKAFASAQKEKSLKPTSIQRKLVSITQFALWAQRRKLVSGVTSEWSSLALDTIFNKNDGPIVIAPPEKKIPLAQEVKKKRKKESLLAAVVLLLLLFGSTIGLYLVQTVQDLRQRAYVDPDQNKQIATTTTTTTTTTGSTDKRVLPFRGKLYSSETGQQIIGKTGASFQLYGSQDATEGPIWESGVCEVSTNAQGIFDIVLGGEDVANGCGDYLNDETYFGNTNLWLSTIINGEQLALYHIKNVEYSQDSGLLAGYPLGDPVVKESILFMNEYGEVLFADEPNFSVPQGDITLSGENLYFLTEGRGGAIFDSMIAAPFAYLGGADNPALVLQSSPETTEPLMVWADGDANYLGVIDNQGNIGIGTENPQGLLGLGDNGAYITSYGDDLLFYDETNGSLLSLSQLAVDNVGTTYWSGSGSDISYSTGNVGVGVTSPEQALGVNGNIQLGSSDADRYIYFDNGTSDNSGIRYNSTTDAIQFSNDGSVWEDLGSGALTSVTNADGTLTVSPTTGDVIASLNLTNANDWTGQQTFGTNVGIATTTPDYLLDVEGTGIVARFGGRVIGADAVNADEFATLGQLSGLTVPSGTSGQTLYHNGTSWTSASNLYNDGTNIGIGTTSTVSVLSLASGTLASDGIAFGSDVNFYRSAADTLKTDDNFVLGTAGVGTTDSVITREADGTLTARDIDSRVWGSSLMSGSGTTDYVTYWGTDRTLAAEQ